MNAQATVPDELNDDLSGPSKAIINKYLEATTQQVAPRALEMDINATVPKLKEQGRLRALRKISKVGLITYRVLGFQGDNTVKKEVIGRYLQAEQQSQNQSALALTPDNYKFKLRGQKTIQKQDLVYVFQVEPRKKRVGLFKGEIWLDSVSFLPVMEKGRFVKNPSIFFRKVDFEREFAIENGTAVPAHLSSTIDTRVVGKVELDINYTAVAESTDDDTAAGDTASAQIRTVAMLQ